MREHLSVLFRRRRQILWVFLGIVAAAALVSFLVPPTYDAESTLLLKAGREYADPSELRATAQGPTWDRRDLLNSEINILTSHEVLQETVAAVGIDTLYPGLAAATRPPRSASEVAIARLRRQIVAYPLKDSAVILVRFEHRDPRVAADTVNRLVEQYQAKRLAVLSAPRTSVLEEQVGAARSRLGAHQEALESFKRQHGVFSLEEQRRLLLRQRADLDTSLKTAESRSNEMADRATALHARLAEMSETVPLFDETERDVVREEAKGRLLALQLRERELTNKYTESSRLVQNVRREIEVVERFLREQDASRKVRTGRSQAFDLLQAEALRSDADRRSLRASAGTIREQIERVDAALGALESSERAVQDLSRQVAMAEVEYKRYSDKLEEARITDDLDRQKLGNVRVIQAAVPSPERVRPRRLLSVVLAAVIGGVVSVGIALLAEHVEGVLIVPERVQRELRIPILGSLSDMEVAPRSRLGSASS